jgi:hypothetical protein
MKTAVSFVVIICIVFVGGLFLKIGNEPTKPDVKLETHSAWAGSNPSSKEQPKEVRVYPIAPGIWYPQDGPIPDKLVRYYRVRCWPGCHSGSPHGKYPKKSLNMKPLFPTSTVKK